MTEIDLTGLLEVASNILPGVTKRISFVFGEETEEDWEDYDIVTPA